MAETSFGDVVGFGISALGAAFGGPVGAPIASEVGGFVGGLIDRAGGSDSAASITAAQQGAISGGFGGPVLSGGQVVGTSQGPPIFSPDPIQAGVGGILQAGVRALPSIVAGAGGAILADQITGPSSQMALPPITTRRQFILLTAKAFAGRGVTAKKIVKAARDCSIEIAAATFGLSVVDVCFLIAQPPTRRSRGISAADLRRTRATVRKVHNIEADFREWCKPVARRRRK